MAKKVAALEVGIKRLLWKSGSKGCYVKPDQKVAMENRIKKLLWKTGSKGCYVKPDQKEPG